MSVLNPAEEWIVEQLQFDGERQRPAHPSVSPDWDQVVDAAKAHGFAGFLLDRAAFLPEPVRAQLAQVQLKVRSTNARHYLALEECLERFDVAGIQTLVLKGAALIPMIYKQLSLRPMIDVDILVHRKDFERAGKLLQAMGFSRPPDLTGAAEETIRTQVCWIRPGRLATAIDLHWHPLDSGYYARSVPVQWFWDHTLKVPLGERTMPILSPEAQLLHLAVHSELHHAGEYLLGAYDMAALLDKFGDSLNWVLILDAAREFEWEQSLSSAVQESQSLFGATLPEWVTGQLKTLRASSHERAARILAEPSAHLAAFLFDGWEQATWGSRVRYLWRSLFPSAEFMRVHGPIRNRRDLIWQYLLRLGRGLYRVPRALWAGLLIWHRRNPRNV